MLTPFLQSVTRTKLPNGLTLLTREDRGRGVVAINTWVKAGYFHEPDSVAGMAHLFEHMFFKGSKHFPGSEEIAQHVSKLGGSTNAGTIYDSTNYYFLLPREGFARGVEIQADAIMNPLFDPDELQREAEVVIEESNRKLDSPAAVVTERMYAVAFTQHRMKRWRIGSHDVLRNIRRDDLVAFFETLYRPANIVLSIAGDVSHEEAIDAVTRTFGQLPVGSLRKERGPEEPPQREFRYGESSADIKQSYTAMGWHTPGEGSADEEPLEVLSTILGGGRYSRLYRNVVGAGGANTVTAFNSVFEDVGIFTVRLSYDEANLAEVERRTIQEIARMKALGPTEFEVALAKNRIESSFVFELEDVLGQAQTLAYFESRGGYEEIAKHLDRVRATTAERVRDVARRYLTIENLTLYRYRPTTFTAAEPLRVEEMIRQAEADAERGELEAIPLPLIGAPPAPAERPRPIQRFILSNGAVVFVKETPGTPTVSSSIYFTGGRLYETNRNAGITQLMARALRRGTTTRDDEQIDREIEFLGTQFGISVDEDFLSLGVDIVRHHFRAGIELLGDVILHPTFPDEGVAEERQLQMAAIQRSLDSSTERPFQLFLDAFYGNHPYALPDAGYRTSVETLDAPALREWHRLNVVADNALIIVVGDVNAEEVHSVLESIFSRLPKSHALHPPVPPFIPPPARLEVVEVRDRRQSAIVVGFPTIPPQHPDWIVLRLLQDITSGLAGTFFVELRAKRSLAYTVFAGDSSRNLAGAFVGYIATDVAKEKEAFEGLLREFHRIQRDGVTEEDLDRAKSYIAGSMRIRLQTNAAFAHEIAQNYLHGLGLDFTDRFLERVRTISLDEVREVARKYLSHDRFTVAILRGRE